MTGSSVDVTITLCVITTYAPGSRKEVTIHTPEYDWQARKGRRTHPSKLRRKRFKVEIIPTRSRKVVTGQRQTIPYVDRAPVMIG